MWSYKLNRDHLDRRGSSPMEQNHSSISTYMGKGGTPSLLQNVQKIIERDHQHNAEQCLKMNELLLRSTDLYKSKRSGFLNRVDKDAKQALSQYAYSIHCMIQNASAFITHTETRNGIVYCYTRGSVNENQMSGRLVKDIGVNTHIH